MTGHRVAGRPARTHAAGLAMVSAVAVAAACAGCAGKATPSRLASDAGDPRTDSAGQAAAATPPVATGDLRVAVRWPDAPASLRAASGYNACGAARRPLVRVHTLGGVADVLVRVSPGEDSDRRAAPTPAGAGSGNRPGTTPQRAAPPELTLRDCRPAPPVVVVPPGERVAVRTDDEGRHEITVQHLGNPGQPSDGPNAPRNTAPAARFALPVAGGELHLAPPAPGVYAVRTLIAPEEPSYLAVAAARGSSAGPDGESWAHTDERGDVRFPDIPVGRYDILVWHPPVAPGGQPIEARADVTVERGATTSATVELQLPGAADASDRDRR